ncbi:MAG: hypothetical protein IH606_04005 [Burkholderiales bacterium]|nr:hypothetical protein [Burkholderiales bacterium]
MFGFRGGQIAGYDALRPFCESAEFLGRGRELAMRDGNILAMMSIGAYSICTSFNCISRPRTADVIVDGGKVHRVRGRQRSEALFALEHFLR